MCIEKDHILRAPRPRWELIVLTVILLLGISAIIIWFPEKMVQQVYRGDRSRESGIDYAKLVDDYRKTLVQIIGGGFLLYTLYLTQRRTKAAEETLRTTVKTLEVTRETQITDRFTKAITQLGATDGQGKKQLEIRFGGIYALERVAKDSPAAYHWPIMEILTAYVRQNSPWRERACGDAEIPEPDKDIQAVMTVIGRSNRKNDQGLLYLSGVDLRRINLNDAHFEKAVLEGAHLKGAVLEEAHLEGAFLEGAHLEKAVLQRAHLKGAHLMKAHLEEAHLMKAHLEEARLMEAHLEGADLSFARLKGAFLTGAHLKGADLMRAHLEGAYLEDARVKWADLSNSPDLTQEQIDVADGDHTTALPQGLMHPEHWPKAPSEQVPDA